MNMELIDLNLGSLPPQLQNLKAMHIRGNSIRYIVLDKQEIGKEKI